MRKTDLDKMMIAKPALADKIFLGRADVDGNVFIGEMRDVTAMAVAATIDYIIDSESSASRCVSFGRKHYKITVQEISLEEFEDAAQEHGAKT